MIPRFGADLPDVLQAPGLADDPGPVGHAKEIEIPVQHREWASSIDAGCRTGSPAVGDADALVLVLGIDGRQDA